MSGARYAAPEGPTPSLPGLGVPSRLTAAFWLALAAEAALVLALIWVVEHRPATRVRPLPVEQVRLVDLPKPVAKPRQKPEPLHPQPIPLRATFHPRPVPLAPPPVTLPAPLPLTPSPIAAPVPPPPPPPPEAPPAVSAGEKASYLGAIRAAIQNAVRFPPEARMLREDGRVRVKFELLDGVVSDVRIIAPGRLKSFNSNALLAVHDASIPSPPKILAHHRFTLVLWVRFHLHRAL